LKRDNDYYLDNLKALKASERYYLSPDTDQTMTMMTIGAGAAGLSESLASKKRDYYVLEKHRHKFKPVNLSHLIRMSMAR